MKVIYLERDSINKDGYNKIASKYHEERQIFNNKKELDYFIELLPKKGKILDVGCGSGYFEKASKRRGDVNIDVLKPEIQPKKESISEKYSFFKKE